MSAVSYYHLTSVRLPKIDIVVYRNHKIRNIPEWLAVKPYYFAEERYKTGIVNINDNGQCFKIYDIHKTVVDIVYYREKILKKYLEILL